MLGAFQRLRIFFDSKDALPAPGTSQSDRVAAYTCERIDDYRLLLWG